MEWHDITTHPVVPSDCVCEIKQANGNVSFGCYHKTEVFSGIIKLDKEENGTFVWNGKTFLIKVTHWKHLQIGAKLIF